MIRINRLRQGNMIVGTYTSAAPVNRNALLASNAVTSFQILSGLCPNRVNRQATLHPLHFAPSRIGNRSAPGGGDQGVADAALPRHRDLTCGRRADRSGGGARLPADGVRYPTLPRQSFL